MTPILEARDLSVVYGLPRRLRDVLRGHPPPAHVAVEGANLAVAQGEITGIVGESGGGKTTLARCLVGMLAPSSGEILIQGRSIGARRSMQDRRLVQMVFQDPFSSLNPRMSIAQTIAELLRVHRLCAPADVEAEVVHLMDRVGLDPALRHQRPRGLSGGQLQRASIARALALKPAVLVADEPVSALDLSVQAVILNLLADLRMSTGMSIVLISHDLAVVSYLCDRIYVMNAGRIVEEGEAARVLDHPRHEYTRRLVRAAVSVGSRSAGSTGPGGSEETMADEEAE